MTSGWLTLDEAAGILKSRMTSGWAQDASAADPAASGPSMSDGTPGETPAPASSSDGTTSSPSGTISSPDGTTSSPTGTLEDPASGAEAVPD